MHCFTSKPSLVPLSDGEGPIQIKYLEQFQASQHYSSVSGAKLRFIHDNGHVASYLFKQSVFRNAIYEALDLTVQKYGQNCIA